VAPAPWRLRTLEEVGSTNDEARRAAEAGEDRVAVRAVRQVAGRGRLGRAWASPPGGLYLSAVVRPSLAAGRVGLLPLAAGVALARVVEGEGLRPDLRWPNDVLVGGRKVAGVLCESRLGPDGALAWAVVGLGLNVAQDPAALALVGGTSLAAHGVRSTPEGLVEAVLAALDEVLALLAAAPDEIREEWARRASMLGKPVEVATHGGRLAGVAEGVASTGALVVRTPDGSQEITDPDLFRVLS
jgi:BirA family transcriptional regulator, biotin operon repressor / biotin---[acetyl-CoA-carboxylase] ligase